MSKSSVSRPQGAAGLVYQEESHAELEREKQAIEPVTHPGGGADGN